MKFLQNVFLLFCFVCLLFFLHPAIQADAPNLLQPQQKSIRILFYNVENLFDTINGPLNEDEEYTLKGEKHWTWGRYSQKLINLYKVIVAAGSWEPPEIIGLCEVENKSVLEGLTKHTPLCKFEYSYIHKDSPDVRGIDVAMLYRKDAFTPLQNRFVTINFPFNKFKKTRDILYTKGLIRGCDTLHIFVNHWPSRSGGLLETEPLRVYVASVLRKAIDSVRYENPVVKILIMGDFNDEPANLSLKTLMLETPGENNSLQLYNLSSGFQHAGTYKYRGRWQLFDQVIVSGSLLDTNSCFYTLPDAFQIFKADFMMEEDRISGDKPLRTFSGLKYRNGYSDHLPVYVNIIVRGK